MIVTQDEPATELYILASGCVRVLLCNDEGREFTLGELQRDEFFGEAALLGDATYSTSVVAVEDVQLLALSRSALFMHLRSNPATGGILAVELARRACAAQQIIGELALLSVESRVVRALLRLAHRDGEVTESGVVLRNRRTHQELANMVGISRETLTRTFSSLAKRGLLSSRGNRLMLSTAIFRHTAPSRDANCE
jgi:CRP/FNR family transcriptional regulator